MDINLQVLVLESVKLALFKIISTTPNILGAVFALITGLILAKTLRKFIMKSLGESNFETFCVRAGITNFLKRVSFNANPQLILANLFYWVAILVAVMVTLEILGLTEVTRMIISFFMYLPNLFIVFLIFMTGVYLVDLSKRLLKREIQTKNYMLLNKFGPPFVQVAIIFTCLSMALYQLGVAKGLLASIYIGLIGSIGLTFFLAFGLASVEIAKGALTGRVLLKPSLEEKPPDVTSKQHELFNFLKDFTKRNNRPPIIREIQEALGDKSTKSVAFKLLALQQKGYIKREKGKHRGIVILK